MVSFAAAQIQNPVEDNRESTVRTVRNLLRESGGFSTGFSEKQSNRLGDRIAMALLEIYSEEEIVNPQNVRRFSCR